MKTQLPIVSFEELYHVGTMKPEHKQEDSYEGAGLSVSICPDEWTRIAKLGGGEVFTLKKSNNQFLNFYEITEEQKQTILSWGINKGYIESKTLFRVEYFDDEMESIVYSDYEDREKAEFEAEDYAEVKEVEGFISTPLMQQKVRGKANPIHVLDLLSTLYVEDETDLDGVYWDEELDVYAYSAPRGVILPSKLSSWSIYNEDEK